METGIHYSPTGNIEECAELACKLILAIHQAQVYCNYIYLHYKDIRVVVNEKMIKEVVVEDINEKMKKKYQSQLTSYYR